MTLTRRTTLAALAALAAGPGLLSSGLASPVRAAPAPPLSPEDQVLVDRAIATLSGMVEMKGRFVQTDNRGSITQGTLYLKRPGKARFAYDPPSGLTVVSDGRYVSVADSRLKTFDRYTLGQTPLALFLAQDIRLDRGVRVSQVQRRPDGFSVTARDARKKTGGAITLDFGGEPLALRGWALVDAQGATTRVRLTSLAAAPGLDPALFALRDPRPRPGGARPGM